MTNKLPHNFAEDNIDMLINCTVVETRIGSISVTFPNFPGKELFFQTDYDQASFAQACGIIKVADPDLLEGINLENIERCPDDYLEVAEDISSS